MASEETNTSSRTVTIGIVADEGFASTIASAIGDALPERVPVDGRVLAIETERSSMALPPTETGSAQLGRWLESVRAHNDYDVVLFLSEIPRRQRSRPVVAELSEDSTAALYIPSFGTVSVRRRAVAVALAIVHDFLGTDTTSRPHLRRSMARWAPGPGPGGAEERILLTPGMFGRLRMVLGMIRCNRPWRLVPTLSGALGAASAASAFGVFYASIWQMAAFMSVQRLAAVGITAIAAMSVWLILPNGMWETRKFRTSTTDRWMYNAATLGTVVSGVLCMYAVLFVVVLGSAAIVISPEFLAEQIHRSANFGDYISLAWLAASLGTVAGAVGSAVADRGDILNATYGHRELIRRQSADEA
ncbi:hypothetical protein A3K89_12985 [Rhodococcoides kyotonense]|uniref:5,10-methylene-tetrahydrofolate dehydrogenase n=1 Tax=Rhodococcoides kyotonense TaxID=398843 RepID=A0A177Y6W0_9NOCA|nr:hypothetical protein A3K89_12985 [Rhodococcus kyotonensis]